MKMWKLITVPVAVLTLMCGQAAAQSEEQRAEQAEERAAEMATRNNERDAAYTERLRSAEARMAAAARQIAELTAERMPRMAQMERRFEFSNKPRLGVTIDGEQSEGAVEGVEITGVTPGSAADDAGLRTDDLITAVNGESMSAENGLAATKRLLDFMHGVEAGDDLKLEYMRNGNIGSVEISPRVMEAQAFSWLPDGQNVHIQKIPGMPSAPHAIQEYRMDFGFPWAGSSWGSMELVELNEGLSKYFGTDSGLLVISAPESGAFDLQDGDVIKSIDGRTPSDVRHALRILGSYKAGESLRLDIMRDKKKRKLDVEVPADQRGSLSPIQAPPQAPLAPTAVQPARAPVAPLPTAEDLAT